ncbi:type II toxin-antitoxin system mRNA interferase toxin, RelE/StbE family [Candidatus Gracilibacteria bacterium]|nr:MAG: type II toxin-antitoxin system mRNA interferase toxin, RelE/StbE family [Candidatus Gracilibacteria bacterium]
MRTIQQSRVFRKNLKKAKSRGKDLTKLVRVIELLQKDAKLPPYLRDHALGGEFIGFRDCHIEPDWVLIYKKEGNTLLLLYMTGSHADLF